MAVEYNFRNFGEDADAEYQIILRMTAADGHPPGFERRFETERRERWYRHNPLAYGFYEMEGRVMGFRTLFPILPTVYWKLRHTGFAVQDLHREDILTPEETERCRRTGLAYFIGSWSEADPQVYQQMLRDTFDTLLTCNLQGVYAETSGHLEDFCRALSLCQLPDKGTCPHTHTAIHAWCADREYAATARTALSGFFQQIDQVYSKSPGPCPPCRLREREKAVAYLYFVKRRTREETAHRLNISPSTVQDHVNAILRATEPFLAPPYLPAESREDSPRTQIGVLLERYPQLLIPVEPRGVRV